MASLEAGQLAGMLTDLLRTAAKDPHPPALHAVHLYTAMEPGADGMELVGESTNRYVAGQAREPAQGSQVPSVLLSLPEAKAVLTLAKGMPALTPVTLATSRDRFIVDTATVRAEHPIVPGPFTDLRRLQQRITPTGQVALQEDVLAPILAVAKRRGEPLGLVFSGRRTAVRILVGDRYQALAMPMNTRVNPRPMWTAPPAPRQAAAEVPYGSLP